MEKSKKITGIIYKYRYLYTDLPYDKKRFIQLISTLSH